MKISCKWYTSIEIIGWQSILDIGLGSILLEIIRICLTNVKAPNHIRSWSLATIPAEFRGLLLNFHDYWLETSGNDSKEELNPPRCIHTITDTL